jgi:hypothetical protein
MILFISFIIIFLLIVCLFLLNKSNMGFKKCIEGMSIDERNTYIKDNIKQMKKNKEYPILSNLGIDPETSDWLEIPNNQKRMYFEDLENKGNIKEGFELAHRQVDKPPPELIKKINKCKTINSCGELATSPNCAYCPDTKKYMYYDNEDFPEGFPEQCNGGLLKSVEDCEIQKCSTINSCSDIALKGAINECGYCPETTRVIPVNIQNGENISKYNYGNTKCEKKLIIGEKCADYDNDACKGSRYSILKPSINCVDDTFNKMGCTNDETKKLYNNDTSLTYTSLVDSIKDYISNLTNSDYKVAKSAHKSCHGNTDKMNPCDNKYKNVNGDYPNDCYKTQGYYKDDKGKEGFSNKNDYLKYCNKNAIGYQSLVSENLESHKQLLKNIEGRDVNMNNLNEYTNYLLKIKEYSEGKGLEKFGRTVAEEQEIQKRAAAFCTNNNVPSRGPLQVGDKIKMEKGGGYMVGYIYGDKGNNVTIMWTEKRDKNNKMLRQRKINNDNEGRQIWGWPGKEYYNGVLLPGEKTYSKRKLKLVKKCDLAGTSGCVLSCDKIIQILKDRYPTPRDCIVSPWHAPNDPNPRSPTKVWGQCSDTCKRGDENPKMTSKRIILQNAARGGKACPKTLIKHKPCNTHMCTDPDFNEAKKLLLKSNLYGCPAQSFTYIGKHGRYNDVWKGDKNRYLNETKMAKVKVTGRYGTTVKNLQCGVGETIMTQSRNYSTNSNCGAKDACVVKLDNKCNVSVMMKDRCKSARSRYKYSAYGSNVSADNCNATVEDVDNSIMHCCTQTRHCSKRHGGWFTNFLKKDKLTYV